MIYLKSLTRDVVTQIIQARGSCIKCTTIYPIHILILEREENRSTRRKTLEAQERATMRNSTHIRHSNWFAAVGHLQSASKRKLALNRRNNGQLCLLLLCFKWPLGEVPHNKVRLFVDAPENKLLNEIHK